MTFTAERSHYDYTDKKELLSHQVRAWSRAALIQTEPMFNLSVLRPMFSCKTSFLSSPLILSFLFHLGPSFSMYLSLPSLALFLRIRLENTSSIKSGISVQFVFKESGADYRGTVPSFAIRSAEKDLLVTPAYLAML